MKKKTILVLSITTVVILAAVFLLWKFVFSTETTSGKKDEEKISVSSIANITGIGSGISAETRFSGVVEPQQTLAVKKDADKKISQLYVAEGDAVKSGDKLFKYDTDDIALKLEQTKLEVETIANKIDTIRGQISDLEKERDKAPDSEQLTYTLQIQSLELDVKTEEYNKTTKANEVTKIEKSLSNTEVTSKIDGVVKSINSSGQQNPGGEEKPYISILSTGNYRVKCTVSELHIGSISQGQPVIVRSRIDDKKTWTGTIESIDKENPIQSNNQNGGMIMAAGPGGDSGNNNTASKYYFFVTLTNFDDLILGQHVYTELDFGQTQKKEGIWLPSPYIMSDGGKSFVWVRDDKEKLVRRQITLGEMDKELDAYQVTEGLQLFDYIAFPQESLKNGMDTVVGDAAPPTNNGTMGGGAMDGAVPEENPAPDDSATKDQTAAAAPQTVN